MDYDDECKRIHEAVREREAANRATDAVVFFGAVLIGAVLGSWAYGTIAHAVLFAFLAGIVAGVGNRVVGESRRDLLEAEIRSIRRREREWIEDGVEPGLIKRRERPGPT